MRIFTFTFMVALLLIFPVAEAPATMSEQDFMSLKLLAHKRTSDGGQTVEYQLRLPQNHQSIDDQSPDRQSPDRQSPDRQSPDRQSIDHRSIEKLEVFYVLHPWNMAPGYVPMFGPDEFYAQSITGDAASPGFTIYCGRSARLDILAGAVIDGRFYSARTFINVYGDSAGSDPNSRLVEALPDWPSLELTGGAAYYRAQAGEELRFSIDADLDAELLAQDVDVFEDGLQANLKPTRLSDGLYSYTTPPYPILSAPSYSVTRDLVFVARIGAGTGTGTEAGSETGSETGTDIGVEAGSGSEAGSETGADVEAGTDVGVDVEAGIDVGVDVEAGIDVEVEAAPEAETNPEADADPEAKTDVETQADPEAKTDVETKADPEAKTDVETKADPEAKADAETKADPEDKADAETRVYADVRQGAVLTFYLPVGRSRFGHLYLQPGLIIVALTAAAAFGAVRLAGRRFKWRRA